MAIFGSLPYEIRPNSRRAAKMTEIDRIDRKILKLLQSDGRIATVDLAEKVGLSPTSTSDRMKRLQREGYIAASAPGSIRTGWASASGLRGGLPRQDHADVFEKFASREARARGSRVPHGGGRASIIW
jgi:Lrp/AsnC family leucine-responsive transcriptional regulator